MKSIFNEKEKELNIVKKVLSYGKHYFISFNGKDESIAKEVLKYNKDFIIVRTNYIGYFCKENVYFFNFDDVDLDLLFTDYCIINTYYAEKYKISKPREGIMNFIYFYMIPDKQSLIEPKDFEKYSYFTGKMNIENILDYCAFEKEIIVDDILFLKFCDKNLIKDSACKKKTNIILINSGIGDFFLTFSIVNEFIDNIKNNMIYLASSYKYNSASINFQYMFNLCYSGKARLLKTFDYNDYFWEYFVVQVEKVTRNLVLSKENGEHITAIFKKYLFDKDDLYSYKHNEILKEKILNNLSNDERLYVDELVENKTKNVGLQYFTGWSNNGTNWEYDRDRKWDVNNTKNFIKQCKENNMNLIVLNPEADEPILQEYCIKKLSIAGYAYLISKMDLVIGVDSSAGHIAAFYDIPSITLWAKGSPLFFDRDSGRYLGFRALRKNYSIVPTNKDISSIDYKTVYSLVEIFFAGDLPFKEEIITYQDSVDGYNILYV